MFKIMKMSLSLDINEILVIVRIKCWPSAISFLHRSQMQSSNV